MHGPDDRPFDSAPSAPPMRPSASVVVCTRNRAGSLARTLDSLGLLTLDEPDRFEVVVVDNGSADATPDVIRAFAGQARFRVTCRLEPRPGLSRARNAGISAARGDVILFTDDDCIVAPDWLAASLAQFAEDRCKVVGGRILLFNPAHLDITTRVSTVPETLSTPAQLFGFVMGANMAFGREALDAIGTFDSRFGAGTDLRAAEDTEFVYRAFIRNVPVGYRPEMRVRHDHGRTGDDAYYGLVRGYYIGNGAMIAMYALKGRFDLVKPLYWDFATALKEWRAGRGSGRAVAVRAASLIGAARFLLLESWRRPA